MATRTILARLPYNKENGRDLFALMATLAKAQDVEYYDASTVVFEDGTTIFTEPAEDFKTINLIRAVA